MRTFTSKWGYSKLIAIFLVWVASHALIPAAIVAYPSIKAILALRAVLRYFLGGTRLLFKGLLARVSGRSESGASPRFAFVSHVLPPEWSGQAVMIKRVLEDIDPSRYCLISSQDYEAGLHGDFIGRLKAKYYWLPPEWQMRSHTNLTAVRWLNLLVAVLTRGFRIAYMVGISDSSVVIGASGDPIDVPAAYVAATITGARFIPYLFDDFTYQWPRDNGRKEAELIERVIFRKRRTAIVPNEFLEREIERRHPEARVVVVHNPTEIGPGKAGAGSNGVYRQGGVKTIVYTGAIYHINLGAFRNLMTAMNGEGMPPTELHLYAAQNRVWLQDRGIAGPGIVLHGHVPPEEVGKVQEQADILFMGFAFDSMIPELVSTSAPGKLGDYLAAGVPILAHVPAGCFVAWYLRRHECGIVVDRDDPEMLARAMKELLSNSELRIRLLRNARERAVADFDPSVARKAFVSALAPGR